MAVMPKFIIKNVPAPKATSQRIVSITRVANGIDFHPPKVLIRKWMNPTIGMPMTKMPEMDINEVVNGDALTIVQST